MIYTNKIALTIVATVPWLREGQGEGQGILKPRIGGAVRCRQGSFDAVQFGAPIAKSQVYSNAARMGWRGVEIIRVGA